MEQLDAAELDMVAGGNAWTLVKVWAGAIASAIGLGPTGGCDSGTMQD